LNKLNTNTLDIDKYYTIQEKTETEIKIKGSKFIGYAAPANSRDMALNFLEEIRAKHFDATHNCYAFQIGWGKNDFRAVDDGEPSGSAGKPILFTIQKFDVSDIIVIVTRYFGGTKLGVGGLMRAYSTTAEEVLKLCKKKIVNRTNSVKIICRYEEISLVKRILDETAISFAEEYSDKIEILAQIPISKTNNFIKQIYLTTNSKAQATLL
jgi:uncharacterized YigZ family protein